MITTRGLNIITALTKHGVHDDVVDYVMREFIDACQEQHEEGIKAGIWQAIEKVCGCVKKTHGAG
jgi:hypothetical protein